MKKGVLLFMTICLFISCNSNDDTPPDDQNSNNVLLLKIDYSTNTFEGGSELTFENKTENFTIEHQYIPPGDFGNIKFTYKELNETLFYGTIIWSGLGERSFPENLSGTDTFEAVLTDDFITPKSGFENVFNPNNLIYDYNPIWSSVQHLTKVRDYLQSNPDATVKLFLYTPSVGVGDPLEWDWYLFIKN